MYNQEISQQQTYRKDIQEKIIPHNKLEIFLSEVLLSDSKRTYVMTHSNDNDQREMTTITR